MPKRSFSPHSVTNRLHHIYRPTEAQLVLGEDPRHAGKGTRRTTFRGGFGCSHPSPFLRDMRWVAMRQITGASGHNACFRPQKVEKAEVVYTATPPVDFLSLPTKSFFDIKKPRSQRPGYVPKADQVARMLTPTQCATEEDLAQPVPAMVHSYTQHFKDDEVPSFYGDRRAGGLSHPIKNKIKQARGGGGSGGREGGEGEGEYMKTLRDALGGGEKGVEAPKRELFFKMEAC